jgi:hypothetical protein
MIRQRFHIERYYWNITAYYAVSGYHYNEIMGSLKRIGCRGEQLSVASENLKANTLNSGITYSNNLMRETVLVVALSSSAEDFHRALMHEIRHLQSHIATAYNIDEKSEEVCYLLDDIVGEIHNVVAPLICECCRTKGDKHHERE